MEWGKGPTIRNKGSLRACCLLYLSYKAINGYLEPLHVPRHLQATVGYRVRLDEWRAANDRTSSVKTCPSFQQRDHAVEIQHPGDHGWQRPIWPWQTTPNHDIVEIPVTTGIPFGGTAAGTGQYSKNMPGGSLLSAGYQVRNFLSSKEPFCIKKRASCRLLSGARLQLVCRSSSVSAWCPCRYFEPLLQDLEAKATSSGPLIAQLCPPNGLGADYAVGIIAGSVDDLSLIRGGKLCLWRSRELHDSLLIAASYDISQAKIETYNKKTWAWNGCEALLLGQTICLSTGTPPFPVSVSNAVCGPQVPGTKKPTSGSSDSWESLPPCPLNVCCNVWGMCGATDDFCVIDAASTGAPGISNCGRVIIKGSEPAETMRVTYFESWNEGRPCLHMDVNQIDTSKCTHVHFAFANITSAFDIEVSGVQAQFDDFKALTDVKRIITFGGWDFSTAPSTYKILREATKSANRAKFESNIVAFVKKHNLDVVDIDWEYPDTLKGLKFTFSTSKSVSLAAPASYWHLKAFTIKEISVKVDCIVCLTYDLHGQRDYGNNWTSPGYATGNCLHSHVNLTETKDALSLITKAGVPSN
ncbi:hypothetical protein E0Z10_g372 [Xylaria hypoxylon]|uniref:chitinase n=1 Tax=Xylaria hypoxylon TaxID=37992 RepID=A0A4Z0YWL1_9PEZI|nr:hypothetical protein E0Z10_g372 [Xylaria hypoxylon]